MSSGVTIDEYTSGIPSKATVDNIINTIWGQRHWIEAIFDLKESTITKYNVQELFFQLIPAKLIGAKRIGTEL